MDLYGLARQFVCSIIAATLSLTVSVVERMLPQRPEWLEKIALLEAQFRAIAHKGRSGNAENTSASRSAAAGPAAADDRGSPASPRPGEEAPVDLQGLVDGYGKLLEFVQYVKIRGLMLDPEFCERVEREWTVRTLLSYMLSAEKSLKEQAAEAHDAAAAYLSARGGRD